MEELSRKAEKEKLAEVETILADATLSDDLSGKVLMFMTIVRIPVSHSDSASDDTQLRGMETR